MSLLPALAISLTLQPLATAILALDANSKSWRSGSCACDLGRRATSAYLLFVDRHRDRCDVRRAPRPIEDIRGVPIVLRLVLQAICSIPLVAACADSSNSTLLLAVTGVVCTIGAVNAVDFMDGVNGIVNGITSGFATAANASLCLIFGYLFEDVPIGAALVVAAACVGFLPYIAGKARMFLGDSGSYGIRAALAGLGPCT